MAYYKHRHLRRLFLEVAPSLLDLPWKSANRTNSPELETIKEERAEEYDHDDE